MCHEEAHGHEPEKGSDDDAIAGTDRGAHLLSVLERIARHSRHDLQRVGLSATVGNPQAIQQDLDKLATPLPSPPAAPIPRASDRPFHWITSDSDLPGLCAALRREPFIGLDVETMIQNRTLCLIQIAASSGTYLLDALALSDLSPLGELLDDPAVAKVIHNASFERSVLKRYGFSIEGVVDTLQVSRRLRGAKLAGGHSLKAVCERELGLTLDKTEQVSDWSQRPLSARQQAYAALDAEVLLRLYEHFGRPTDGENLDLWGTMRGSKRLHQLSKRWADSREFWGLAGVQALGEFMKYDADLWRKASAYKGLRKPASHCWKQYRAFFQLQV